MHPAFSVIFFTTLSGAGYGLWFWLGVSALTASPLPRIAALIALVLGFVLVSTGLLSSTLHLGQPQRAWRALSQWRSSWLSREGVASMLCFLPMLWFWIATWSGSDTHIAAMLLAALSMVTVWCTAMIYASLKPVPAWRHPLVVPVYLLFAIYTGGLLLIAMQSLLASGIAPVIGLAVPLLAFILWRIKHAYWRSIDHIELPATRASALGLPANADISVFERPHTEANYLTREMGFVLARKHGKRLRMIAVLLFALAPALCALPLWLGLNLSGTPWPSIAALSAIVGSLVERWLFFAEAQHVVTLYY